jgi:hypothetical protein
LPISKAQFLGIYFITSKIQGEIDFAHQFFIVRFLIKNKS